MKKILLSVRPKYCELIFNGKKTIEVRRTRPKLEPPFEVLVYMTKPKPYLSTIIRDGDDIYGDIYHGKTLFIKSDRHFYNCNYKTMGQGVIGSFICDEIYSFITFGAGAACIDSEWKQISPKKVVKETCLTEQQIMDYLERGIGNYEGYGWHITEPKLFDKPKLLSDFYIPCKYYEKGNGCPEDCGFFKQNGIIDRTDDFCEGKRPITRPPQSWIYCEEHNAN